VIAVVGGVVALASQDGHELGVGLEEAAALADGLEPTVELSRSRAVPVGEQPPVRRHVDDGSRGEGGGVGFDGAGGVEVLLGHLGVGDAGIDERHACERCPSSAAMASNDIPRLRHWVARVWRSW
jgi:hypothetical protein